MITIHTFYISKHPFAGDFMLFLTDGNTNRLPAKFLQLFFMIPIHQTLFLGPREEKCYS